MWFLPHARVRKFRRALAEQRDFYQYRWTPDDVRNWQREQFNLQWQTIRREVPYYRRLCEQSELPGSFSTWSEFQQKMPFIDRKTVHTARDALMSDKRAPDYMRTTGGSTAEPVQIPSWKTEKN